MISKDGLLGKKRKISYNHSINLDFLFFDNIFHTLRYQSISFHFLNDL